MYNLLRTNKKVPIFNIVLLVLYYYQKMFMLFRQKKIFMNSMNQHNESECMKLMQTY